MRIKKLIKSLKSQDNAKVCFEEIFNTYKSLLFYIAYEKLRDKELSEDIVQETFLRFFKNITRVETDKNIKYYLVSILNNLICDERANAIVKVEYNDEILLENQNYKYEDLSIFKKYRKYLTEKEFDALVLHLGQDLKFKDVARIRNITVDSASSLYTSAIRKLKVVAKKGDFYE